MTPLRRYGDSAHRAGYALATSIHSQNCSFQEIITCLRAPAHRNIAAQLSINNLQS